jgi:hypothetical protein
MSVFSTKVLDHRGSFCSRSGISFELVLFTALFKLKRQSPLQFLLTPLAHGGKASDRLVEECDQMSHPVPYRGNRFDQLFRKPVFRGQRRIRTR